MAWWIRVQYKYLRLKKPCKNFLCPQTNTILLIKSSMAFGKDESVISSIQKLSGKRGGMVITSVKLWIIFGIVFVQAKILSFLLTQLLSSQIIAWFSYLSDIINLNSMQNYLFYGQQQAYPLKEENEANAGSWSLEQNVAYAIFVDLHKKSMTSKKKMREMQFYDKLSAFIATRTTSQCRSHHQKLFDKFKYISKIVELFKNEVGLANYKTKYLEGIEKMKEINQQFSSVRSNDSSQPELPVQAPLPISSQIPNTLYFEMNMVPIPLFFNNLYYFTGFPGVQGPDKGASALN